jgi:hypothetical protein
MDTQSAFILAFFIKASRFSTVELLKELARLQLVEETIPGKNRNYMTADGMA